MRRRQEALPINSRSIRTKIVLTETRVSGTDCKITHLATRITARYGWVRERWAYRLGAFAATEICILVGVAGHGHGVHERVCGSIGRLRGRRPAPDVPLLQPPTPVHAAAASRQHQPCPRCRICHSANLALSKHGRSCCSEHCALSKNASSSTTTGLCILQANTDMLLP